MSIENNENYKKLKQILVGLLDLDETIDVKNINQDEIEAWSSSMHLNIIMEIEAEFNVSFKIEDVYELRSFDDILMYISSK